MESERRNIKKRRQRKTNNFSATIRSRKDVNWDQSSSRKAIRFKFLVVTLCTIICAGQLYQFFRLYYSYPVVVEVDTKTDSTNTIPSIVLDVKFTFLRDSVCEKSINSTCKGLRTEDAIAYLAKYKYEKGRLVTLCMFVSADGNIVVFKPPEICESFIVSPKSFGRFQIILNAYYAGTNFTNLTSQIELSLHLGDPQQNVIIEDIFIVIQSPISVSTGKVGTLMRNGNIFKTSFRRTVVHSLPAPFKSMCRNYSRTYGELESFSQENCVMMCVAKQMTHVCGCVYHDVPVPVPQFEICNKTQRDSCWPIFGSEQLKFHLLNCESNCPLACYQEYYEEVIFREERESRFSRMWADTLDSGSGSPCPCFRTLSDKCFNISFGFA